MAKERYQNPAVGDELRLRLVSFNSNALTDVQSVDSVAVYHLDPTKCTEECPDGQVLTATYDGSEVVHDATGSYSLTIPLSSPTYVIGKYKDIWTITTSSGSPGTPELRFEIFPELYYFSSMPAVYSFDFRFQPNRIRQGSFKWLIFQITPNVPRATDLERYYTNLAISSNLYLSMEKACGPCIPPEEDARLILDRVLVDQREKVFGYYQLDTRELDCGIYNVWVELEFAGTIEVSPKMNLQIF